jgi:hypothetical protein
VYKSAGYLLEILNVVLTENLGIVTKAEQQSKRLETKLKQTAEDIKRRFLGVAKHYSRLSALRLIAKEDTYPSNYGSNPFSEE